MHFYIHAVSPLEPRRIHSNRIVSRLSCVSERLDGQANIKRPAHIRIKVARGHEIERDANIGLQSVRHGDQTVARPDLIRTVPQALVRS